MKYNYNVVPTLVRFKSIEYIIMVNVNTPENIDNKRKGTFQGFSCHQHSLVLRCPPISPT